MSEFDIKANDSGKGTKGLLALYCTECGRSFTTATKRPLESVRCRCGCDVSTMADEMTKFKCRCDKCERMAYGHTNALDGDEIDFRCKCGSDIRLEYRRRERMFRGLSD